MGYPAPYPNNIDAQLRCAWQLGIDDYLSEKIISNNSGPGSCDDQLALPFSNEEVNSIYGPNNTQRMLPTRTFKRLGVDMNFTANATIHYVERRQYTVALIQQALHQYKKPSVIASKIGISRQHVYLLSLGKRNASYAVQFCLEMITGKHPQLDLEIDATKYYRKQPDYIADLAKKAEIAAGGPVKLSNLLGVSRQYPNRLQASPMQSRYRSCRYPTQVLMQSIIVEYEQLQHS